MKKKRNLPRDLPQGRPNSEPIPELYEISFYDGRFSKKRFINWDRVGSLLLFQQGSLSSKDKTCRTQTFLWWFEFLDFRTRIGMLLIPSWQDLRRSLILEFI